MVFCKEGIRLLRPISWLEHPEELSLERIRRIHRRIVPRSNRWEAHEHTLDPGTSLQAKESAAVMYQIELGVASPSHQLKVTLPLTERDTPPPIHNGAVGG